MPLAPSRIRTSDLPFATEKSASDQQVLNQPEHTTDRWQQIDFHFNNKVMYVASVQTDGQTPQTFLHLTPYCGACSGSPQLKNLINDVMVL